MPKNKIIIEVDFMALKSVLESGKIGQMVRLESHYDYFRENGWYDTYGTLYNLAVHTVDQIISFSENRTGQYLTCAAFTIPGLEMITTIWSSFMETERHL